MKFSIRHNNYNKKLVALQESSYPEEAEWLRFSAELSE